MLNRLKRVPWPSLLNLPLTAVLGYTLMRLFLPTPSNASVPISNFNQPATHSAQVSFATQTQLNMRSVLQAHLFGQNNRANPTKAAEPAPIKAPETKLQLTLQGTLITDNKQNAKAIIAPKNGQGKEYEIGKLLPGGAKLQDIQVDKVILERQRRLETLSLVNEKAKAGVSMTTSQSSAPPLPPIAVSNTDQDLSQSLQQYRQRILDNPAEMGKLIRITPSKQHGKFVGYRLRPGRDPTLFNQAGLRTGDVLTHLNGTALDSPMKGLSALQELAKTDFLDLQVLRNGSVMQFSLSLR